MREACNYRGGQRAGIQVRAQPDAAGLEDGKGDELKNGHGQPLEAGKAGTCALLEPPERNTTRNAP